MSHMNEPNNSSMYPNQDHYPGAKGLEEHGPSSGWAGLAFFAAMLMILLGSVQALTGLVALFNDSYFQVTRSGLLVNANYTTWGVVHIVLGVAVVIAAVNLMRGATWARIVGIILAMVSVVVNIGFLEAAPVWGVIMITLDVLVIYAIAMHGGELKNNEPDTWI